MSRPASSRSHGRVLNPSAMNPPNQNRDPKRRVRRHIAVPVFAALALLAVSARAQNPANPFYSGAQPSLVQGTQDGPADGAPKIRHVYAAAPDVLAFVVDAQHLWAEPVKPYVKQPGDVVRRARPEPYGQLPANLPVPRDDGAAAHLPGRQLPDVSLASTSGQQVNLRHRPGRIVLYAYPLTGRPGVPLPPGWDEIPGARGCTPESCAFRDHHAELRGLGAEVFGLSTQSTDYQREVRERLHLPFDLLSDEAFSFADALSLPTFTAASTRLLRRLTLISAGGTIERVFYPVFPPDKHPAAVVEHLRTRNP